MTEVQCRCGEIAMRIGGDPVAQLYCHCADCQTANNAAYAPNSVYHAQHVEIVRGAPGTVSVKSTPRLRCRTCGTALFTEVKAANLRSLNAYLLPPGRFEPQCHIYCKDALLPVIDTLPHYRGLPAAFGGSDDVVDW